MQDTMSRKKASKPADLLKGKYSQKELDERKEKEANFTGLMTKDELNNIPSYLNDYGVKYYKLLMEQLQHISLLTDLDKPSLTNLAFILGVLEESHIHVKENSLLIPSTNGPKPNPHLKIIKDYTTLFMNLAKSMSLTPEMRQHMQKLTEENTSQFTSEDNMELINNLLGEDFGDE